MKHIIRIQIPTLFLRDLRNQEVYFQTFSLTLLSKVLKGIKIMKDQKKKFQGQNMLSWEDVGENVTSNVVATIP